MTRMIINCSIKKIKFKLEAKKDLPSIVEPNKYNEQKAKKLQQIKQPRDSTFLAIISFFYLNC